MIKDEFDPEEKTIKDLNDLGFIPLPKPPIITTRSWLNKPNVSDNVRITNGNFMLVDSDNIARFFAGKDENGEWVVKLSKQGVDARIATNSQVLFSSNVIFFEQVFSGSYIYPPAPGFRPEVDYDTSIPINQVAILLAYIDPSWTITGATLQVIAIHDPLGADAPDISNGTIYLNPTKSVIALSYYRYSGGTTITTGLSPTLGPDDETFSFTLTPAQISGLISGWNHIVIQNETDADETTIFDMTLVIQGYVNL